MVDATFEVEDQGPPRRDAPPRPPQTPSDGGGPGNPQTGNPQTGDPQAGDPQAGHPQAGGPRAGPSRHSLAYRGASGPIFRIAMVNSLLSLLTIGLYRFWARTRLRRYFWSHVELDGDPIEYTGTGRQLFIGFLIVLAVLVPLLFGLDYVAALFPQDAWQQGVIGLFQGFGLLFLIQYAIFRARRYRLGHTRWRGIRASQTGSALAYAVRAFGYLLLSILTLGLAHPLYRTRTQRFLVENTHFGTQPFRFDGSAGALFRMWFPAWLLTFVAGAIAFLGTMFVAGFIEGVSGGSAAAAPDRAAHVPSLILAFFIAAFAALLVQVWYRTREFRYFTSVTRFGPVRFASELKARSIVKIYGLYYLLLIVLFLIVAAVLQSLFFDLGRGPVGSSPAEILAWIGPGMLAAGVFALLVVATLLGTLQPVLIGHPLVARVIGTLRTNGYYDMEELLQGVRAAEGRGEGLADAFDVDVAGF